MMFRRESQRQPAETKSEIFMFLSKWLKKEKSVPKIQTNVQIQQDAETHSATDSAFGEDLNRIDFITELPYELACQILLYLDPTRTIPFVSKTWNRVANDNLVWRQQFLRKWGLPAHIGPQSQKDWKLMCQKRKKLRSNWLEGRVEARVLEGHLDSVYCLQFDSEKIISGSRDNTMKIWDMKTMRCVNTLRYHTGSVLCLQYNSKYLVSGSSDCSIVVWDIHTLEDIRVLVGHTMPVLDVRLTDQHIVSSSKDCTIKIWDLETGELLRTLEGHTAPVNSLHIHEDCFVSASGDGEIRMWDIHTGGMIRIFKGHARGLACVQYDGKMIVSGSSDNSIKIWNAKTGECLKTLQNHTKLVRSLALDNEHIVSGSYDQTIKVYDAKNGELLLDLAHAHRSWIFHVQADAARIVSAGQVIVPHLGF
jgi:F-box and WD-40 domain protein 1/11